MTPTLTGPRNAAAAVEDIMMRVSQARGCLNSDPKEAGRLLTSACRDYDWMAAGYALAQPQHGLHGFYTTTA